MDQEDDDDTSSYSSDNDHNGIVHGPIEVDSEPVRPDSDDDDNDNSDPESRVLNCIQS